MRGVVASAVASLSRLALQHKEKSMEKLIVFLQKNQNPTKSILLKNLKIKTILTEWLDSVIIIAPVS